jgi:ABC-type antimicrobial peptide transport system permease subunit
MAPLLQSSVSAVHPDVAASGFTTMEDALAATLGPERILAGLASAFAVAAMLLAAVGLYAVLAHAVAARTVEIGIRMAIGASRPAIVQLILCGALRLVFAGIAAGLIAALAASRVVSAQLHGVSARDPVIYAGVGIVFMAVGVLAALVPARRATRVDPLVSLTTS